MKEEMESVILGIIEHNDLSQPDLNYIVTPQSVKQRLSCWSMLKNNQLLEPQESMIQVDRTGTTKRCSVLVFHLDDPIQAAEHLSRFVNGAWNHSDYELAPDRCSVEGIQLLSLLLKPFQSAKPGSELTPEHVAQVLTKLAGLEVKRRRYSVTQSSVSIKLLSHSMVDFSDEIWLRKQDGSLTNGRSNISNVPMYGDIIDGWGSITPDSEFLKAAITQFPNRIAQELEDYSRNKFLDMIQSAALRTKVQSSGYMPALDGYAASFE